METFVYLLIGIKKDGGDDTITINASCETEAEIIIESFHDGIYHLKESSMSAIYDAAEQQMMDDWEAYEKAEAKAEADAEEAYQSYLREQDNIMLRKRQAAYGGYEDFEHEIYS